VPNGTACILASGARGITGQAAHSAQAGHRGGGPAQPARIRIATRSEASERAMWVIYLEMGVALAMLLLIVWFTWPRKRQQEQPKQPPADKDAD
jgi:hypothetical protein